MPDAKLNHGTVRGDSVRDVSVRVLTFRTNAISEPRRRRFVMPDASK